MCSVVAGICYVKHEGVCRLGERRHVVVRRTRCGAAAQCACVTKAEGSAAALSNAPRHNVGYAITLGRCACGGEDGPEVMQVTPRRCNVHAA